MGARCRLFLGIAAAVWCVAATSYGQDSQSLDSQSPDSSSLGDVARQQRQQKEKSKTAHDHGKDDKGAKASRVITNEEIPEHAGPEPGAGSAGGPVLAAHADGAKQAPQDVKSQIQAQQSAIASLQKQIDEVNESIKFAPANCVSGCERWNERQREKQQQVARMEAQLEDQQKHLEEMQESARKQGLGSSVYEP